MRKIGIAFMIVGSVMISDLFAEDMPVVPTEKLYHESLRPQFHFTARYWEHYELNPQAKHEGWMNDINGLVYNEGEYHLFAQRWWAAWLHAVSTDLVHWKELRPAFGQGGKFGGTQSGGGVVDINNCSGLGDGTEPPMIAFWSSTDNQSQCISYSLDKGRTWVKYDKNPVLVHKYRDPKVFWYEPDKKWVMALFGPSDGTHYISRYGFNGFWNDATEMRDYTPGEWICSAIRLFGDGKVIATDQHGTSEAKIDIDRENIGADTFCVGANINGHEFLVGDIAEILVYDSCLSDKRTQDVLTGLQYKWGLSGSDSQGAIPTEGLVLRLDAANVTTENNGRVSTWESIVGNKSDIVQTEPDRMPKLVNEGLGGKPVIQFEGKQFLKGPAVLAEGDDTFTIVALWRREKNIGGAVVCEQTTKELQAARRACLLTFAEDRADDHVYWLFSSTNLLDWKNLDSYIPNMFECPDMFEMPVDGRTDQMKWVVVNGNGEYVIGSFDGQRFTPESKGARCDYGGNFYATMTFQNMPKNDQRRIQLAWMGGEYPKNMPFNQQATFPCELTLHRFPQGIVMYRYPIREISKIYGEEFSLKNQSLKPGENPLSGLQGELFDINMVIDITQSTCSEVILNLRGNTVKYDINRKILDSVNSQVPLEPRKGLVEVRVLMDRLSIESYGNRGEVSITNIAYQKEGTPSLELKAVGGKAKVVSLTAHKLKSIWK